MSVEETPIWNVGIVAPLYRRSPTEWPVLLTILKHAQKINCITAGEGCRPIITLDGDLYDRAVKLKDYKEHWCIRLGALHMTMAALKCLGKYVEGSGIDMAWEASGLYGSATVRQILDGRHIYRCIQAHVVTLVAVFSLFLLVVFSDEERRDLGKRVSNVCLYCGMYLNIGICDTFASVADGDAQFKNHVAGVQQMLSANTMFERMTEWKESSKGIQRFLTNYMTQVQSLLMFIGATRTCSWKLHLAKVEELLPYFHAHDQYNYGRWGPLYMADMLELQTTDPETWKFLDDGNFAITKHTVPFTAIDPDHAIEQEHKKMKSRAGFIGITGNEPALDKYFIIAPTLSRLVEEFQEYAGIEQRNPSSLHHEFAGERASKLVANASKLVQGITKQGNPFLKSDMSNLVTFAVPPDNIIHNIQERDALGRKALEKFVTSRMTEETVPFWDSQKKNKFLYFKGVSASVQTKLKGQLVSIKQERQLLSRLLVVSKERSDIVLKDAIGDFEFNVAPPSNFHSDGSMIMISGKAQTVPSILNMPLSQDIPEPQVEDNAPTVLIIDAMCVVNMITKTPEMSNAAHFATKFVDTVATMSSSYDEVRVVFDQYVPDSLKQTTRDKRTDKSSSIQYLVNDNTEIKSIKTFLSHINTKADLTKYLADKLMSHYHDNTQRVVVMHHGTIVANCPLPNVLSMPELEAGKHDLEEGDQLVLLNAFDVMDKHPESKLDIFSLDTDVFILITGHYHMLPKSTTIIRKRGERLAIHKAYARLGRKRTDALIGWYAFKGTDNTGSFAGKGVLSNVKAFLQSDDAILDTFAAFGKTTDLPNWIFAQIERYVCLLYATGDVCASTVRDLRWSLFAQQGKEGQQLPPTMGTLIPHTHRAFYMALVWKTSIKPCPQLPSPTNYYWESIDNRLQPVYCINSPAPELCWN